MTVPLSLALVALGGVETVMIYHALFKINKVIQSLVTVGAIFTFFRIIVITGMVQ